MGSTWHSKPMPGMHWSCNGEAGILTLRYQEASNRWEQVWQTTAQPDADR